MTNPYEQTHLWKSTLAERKKDDQKAARDRLRGAFLKFRERVEHLVSFIGPELPGLTVHDITHLDALWRVADQITGPNYVLTPAEAFVFGGAVLLHDSAHAIAAYPGGKTEIKQTQHWRDLIAQRFNRNEPAAGSDEERAALFQVLRHVHATQAAKLPFAEWRTPSDTAAQFLLEDAELRNYYGELIGRIAESHHWAAQRVASEFNHEPFPPPAYLPTEWTVDPMKIAFMLRTADAAHIDNGRAPWFLFALKRPTEISERHWRFQSKFGQPRCTAMGNLQLSATSSFAVHERDAWWLAFDTAQMIDRELRHANGFLRDSGRKQFRAASVLGAESAQSFALYAARPLGWEPVDVSPKIGNINRIIEMLGGEKLYGDHPEYALRELLQNAIDAIQARRAMGGLGKLDGEIEVGLDRINDQEFCLRVSDNGIGMSKHVLTNVLLDFGYSLWGSDEVREHLPGLTESGFRSGGQFGIGFFSVFMLSEQVTVQSRAAYSIDDSHTLEFNRGLRDRPVLMETSGHGLSESCGTTVRVNISLAKLDHVLSRGIHPHTSLAKEQWLHIETIELSADETIRKILGDVVAFLVPCSPVDIRVTSASGSAKVVNAFDWQTISNELLLRRIGVSGDVNLLPITDTCGTVVGRVGLDSAWTDIPLLLQTFRGTLCGFSHSFIGVYEVPAPANVARTEAASRDLEVGLWGDWANRYLDKFQHELDEDQMVLMHALVPARDLPVYQVDGEWVTLAELKQFVVKQNEVAIFGDFLSVERDERFSQLDFDAHFIANEKCIFLSSMIHYRRDYLSVPKVLLPAYLENVRDTVAKIWLGASEQVVERYEVGKVLGLPVLRSVTVLTRTQAAK